MRYAIGLPQALIESVDMNMINAVVSDRKIEIQAPNDLPDGSKVMVLVVSAPNNNSDAMSSEEIFQTLRAMDLFDATFRTNENGEDLS